MKTLFSLAATIAIAVAVVGAQGDERKRVAEATTVIGEMMDAGDSSIPRAILEKAEGIAVFPSLLKGGLGVGGQHGRGVLSVRDAKTGAWSAPAFLTINGGSIGFQAGAQAIDLVLVVNNRRGLEQLVGNQFKVGADASVAAGPVGRDASASTDIQMRAQILSYSRTRGLFAGVTINGTTIRQDRDANGRFYGTAYRTGQIVFDGLGGAPEPVAAWTAALTKYAK
ncbi:MAG: lipid-binding SYLF domain-containing protein [Vicinamibacterales bacterium]